MSDPVHEENPDPGTLADDQDELGWDVERHGRMRDHATDDEPATEPYEPPEEDG